MYPLEETVMLEKMPKEQEPFVTISVVDTVIGIPIYIYKLSEVENRDNRITRNNFLYL